MNAVLKACAVLIALVVFAVATPARCEDSQAPVSAEDAASAQPGRAAIERGLNFLQADAAKWRAEHECATCHHGTFTVWALSEARQQGYAVEAEALADAAKWTKDRWMERADLPRDTRPGWSMVSTPLIYLALLPQAVPNQQVLSADELQRIAGHLLRHQEADGSWSWASAPAKNRAPPFFESDEVATRLAYLALGPQVPADAAEPSPVRTARQQAAEWLAKTPPNDTTQAAALRLLMKVQANESAETLQPEIAAFLRRQHQDGGWGQLAELSSDGYATGQALYALNLAGAKHDRAEIQRGVTFLVGNQQADGSWPMTRRGHPGVTPGPYSVPIIYFGSAWATLGLLRSVPN